MSITFNLVQNAKWHDGEPVTSKDVKYTFDYIKDHPECFAHNYFKNVESISAPDDYTVVFHMSRPDSAVLGYLAWYATFIMPEHVYNNGQPWEENPANQAPIGSGPFKFEKHNPGVNVVLVKNSEYWEAEPKLDRLIYQIIPDDATAVQALLNGEVDYMTLPATEVESFKSNPDFTLVPYSLPSPLYMVFNFDEGKDVPFAVRKAIAMCINRDEISTKVFAGIQPPEYNFYPSVMGWSSNSDAPAPSFDIEGAKAVLEAAGYTKDAEGYYVRGLVVDCFSQSYIDAVKLISAACKDAGIELIINALEGQAWSTKVSTNQDFVIATLGGFQGPDVSALAGRISTEGAMNHGDYSNARIDEPIWPVLCRRIPRFGSRTTMRFRRSCLRNCPLSPSSDTRPIPARRPTSRIVLTSAPEGPVGASTCTPISLSRERLAYGGCTVLPPFWFEKAGRACLR